MLPALKVTSAFRSKKLEIRQNGLAMAQTGQASWRIVLPFDSNVGDSFASFLRLLLDEHWLELRDSAVARAAFMAFALKLASLQHQLGTEVLALAGNRFGTIP